MTPSVLDMPTSAYYSRRVFAPLVDRPVLALKVNIVLPWDSLLWADFVGIVAQYRIGCLASRDGREDGGCTQGAVQRCRASTYIVD